ncbi:MAG: hypothetical protein OEZ34_10935 [Spirochaetia bacterium]|nr:hypothetical protein [Spirochaetia bacterium]
MNFLINQKKHLISLITKFVFQILILFAFSISTSNCKSFFQKKTPESEESLKQPEIISEDTPDQTEKIIEENKIPLQQGKNLLVEKRKNKSGKIITTKFYGRELIRQKVTEKGITFTRISLKGNATIEHEGVLILSPLIILDQGEIGRTVGGVRVIDKKEGMTINAGSAVYSKKDENIILSKNPLLVIQKNKKESKTIVTTNRMVRDLSEKTTTLDGDVRIFRDSWTVLGDKGIHRDSTDEIVLEKNPVILDKNKFLTGTNLRYKLREKKIVLDDRVFSSIRDETEHTAGLQSGRKPVSLEEFARKGGRLKGTQENKDENYGNSEISILSSDSITYDYSGSDYPVAEVTGNVLLTQEDFYLKSPVMKTKGKSFETIYTKSGVEMMDKKEGIHVTAGEMFYERTKRIMRLDLYPKMEFLDKENGEIEGTLEAAVIETNFITRETYARGNVVLYEKQFSATGEVATYKSKEDLIIMEGSPTITQGGGTVSSEKIYIYPRSNRVLLKNRIRGSMSEG